ncbi:hypothetical protein ACX0G9_09215 [Flavitalea flava]
MNTRRNLLIASMILSGTLLASASHAQVYVSAHIGFGFPAPRVYYAPPPPPVVYEQRYAPAPVVYQESYPMAEYYTYPAWQGHYRDRCYYEHYRPNFERDRRYHGNRWERERHEDNRDRNQNEHHDRGRGHGREW